MVESFGDGRSVEEDVAEPPFGIPQIAVMLVPVVDAAALEEAATLVREAIAEAVRAGFNDAMGELVVVEDDSTPQVPSEVPFDANPTVNSRDMFAYQKYAERLDREAPGWWRMDVPYMHENLRAEARKRQATDTRAGR